MTIEELKEILIEEINNSKGVAEDYFQELNDEAAGDRILAKIEAYEEILKLIE